MKESPQQNSDGISKQSVSHALIQMGQQLASDGDQQGKTTAVYTMTTKKGGHPI